MIKVDVKFDPIMPGVPIVIDKLVSVWMKEQRSLT